MTFAIVGVAAPNSTAAAKCLVAFTCLYIFTYGATWGPVPQVILGEVPSNRLRSKTMALATTVNWMCTLFIICGMPYLISDSYANLGTKVGFIFGGCTILTVFWTIFSLPETKDRTLEQIDEMFLNVSSHTDLLCNTNGFCLTRLTESTNTQVQRLRLHGSCWSLVSRGGVRENGDEGWYFSDDRTRGNKLLEKGLERRALTMN